MASGSVRIDFSGNPAGAQKAFDKLQQQVVKLRAQLQQLNATSAKGMQAQQRGALAQQRANSSSLGGLKAMAGGYLSVMQAVMQVTAAIRDMEEAQNKSKTTTISLAEAQESAIHMLGIDIPTEVFTKRIADIESRVRPKGGQVGLTQTAAGVLSIASYEKAMQALEVGTQFGRFNQENAEAIAKASLSVGFATGSEDLMKNIGWLIAGTSTSRVEELAGMAKYAIPTISAVTSTGGSPEEAMALFNTITKVIEDPQGRKGGTGAIAFAESLAKYLPEKDTMEEIIDPQGAVLQTLKRKGTGLQSYGERVDYLKEHPEQFEVFASSYLATLPKKTLGGLRAFMGIHKNEELNRKAQEAYAETMAVQPKVADAGVWAEKKLKQLRGSKEYKVASAELARESGIERLQLDTKVGQRMAAAAPYQWGGEKGLGAQLQATGMGYFNRKFDYGFSYLLDKMMGVSQEENYRHKVERRIKEMEYGDWWGEARGAMGFAVRDVTPEEAEQIVILKDILRNLEESLGDSKKQTTALETAARTGRGAANANAAAATEPR